MEKPNYEQLKSTLRIELSPDLTGAFSHRCLEKEWRRLPEGEPWECWRAGGC